MRNNRSLSLINRNRRDPNYFFRIVQRARQTSGGKFDTNDTSARPGKTWPASRKLYYRLKCNLILYLIRFFAIYATALGSRGSFELFGTFGSFHSGISQRTVRLDLQRAFEYIVSLTNV